MNKHFSAILAIMDTADIVPDEIRFTKDRDILISSEFGFDEKFSTDIENYCNASGLELQGHNFAGAYYLIKNPKNAAI